MGFVYVLKPAHTLDESISFSMQDSLDETFAAQNPAEVFRITNTMLSKLGSRFRQVQPLTSCICL